ncbi:MAG TPA: right-handed parallel beta-helix repeat-containing protein [Thiolinea sp.]|nr:right-handed parallel beta-helix repeat-containing protein [Thiolinea sp.]
MKTILSLLLPILLTACNDGHVPHTGTDRLQDSMQLADDYRGRVFVIDRGGLTLDLNGHTITPPSGRYAVVIRASNVTVTNGRIIGDADAGGIMIDTCATAPLLQLHNTDLEQADAIRADCHNGNTITGIEFSGLGSHIYAGAFTTRALITGNSFTGSDESSIYLDAEGGHNTIAGNQFERCGWSDDGRNRECIAVDGNADNYISGNSFTEHARKRAFGKWHIGDNWPVSAIGLYRNCGEQELGVDFVRRQGADRNLIEGNTFTGGSSGIIFAMRTPQGRNFDSKTCPLQIPDRAEHNTERGNVFMNVLRPVLDYGKTNTIE